MRVYIEDYSEETIASFDMPDGATGQQIVNHEIELGYNPMLYMFKIEPFVCKHCSNLRATPGKCASCHKL